VAPHVETEIKLKVAEPGELSNRLVRVTDRLKEMGATISQPREFEDNYAFDFPDRRIVLAGSLLRVRILSRGTLLTFKGPVGQNPLPGRFKAREETEVSFGAADAGALMAIMKGMGMEPVFQYQKYRTAWEWRDLHILVDETPIGTYLELEGPEDLIDEGARELGYGSSDYITSSYRDLYLTSFDQGSEGDRSGRSRDRMVFGS
jgi:adenylate cyclase, class 2